MGTMTPTYPQHPMHPPGPAGFDRIRAIQHLRMNPLEAAQSLAQTYGDIVYLHLGPYHIYLLNHPDHLHEVLVRQNEIMRKPRSLSQPIAEFLGNGLLISHGDYWKQQRRNIQPAFHPRYGDLYSRVMVECLLDHLDTWQDGHIYDVDHEFMMLTLRMVTRALFGSDTASASGDIANAVKILQRISYRQGQAALPVPGWIPLPAHLSKQRAINLLDEVVMRIVQDGRKRGANDDTLLDMLLNAVDDTGSPLTDQQICDEVMTVLLAGHESTANAIGWMWYLLGQHETVSARLYDELDGVLGGHPPTAADLPKLHFNTMIVKEALRLYPPAWALPREPVMDTCIHQYHIKKGSLLVGMPFVIQRDARYYDQPDQFMPERFADHAEKHLPRHAYLPFGAGPRFCVGSSFALLAMQLTLATIHSRYALRLVENQRVILDPLLTLRPRHGILMQVFRR
jgi:cytochrome P450